MTKRIVLAGLLALAAVPVLGADAASGRKVATPVSTDEARAMAGKQIAAQEKAEAASARACTCSHGH
jgi:hypothetical protein